MITHTINGEIMKLGDEIYFLTPSLTMRNSRIHEDGKLVMVRTRLRAVTKSYCPGETAKVTCSARVFLPVLREDGSFGKALRKIHCDERDCSHSREKLFQRLCERNRLSANKARKQARRYARRKLQDLVAEQSA